MTAIPAGYAVPGGGYPVGLDVDPPEAQSRLTVFFRLLMVIPHLIVIYFLNIGLGVVTLIAWFAILFTGKYPAGLATFSSGVQQWMARVMGYEYLLSGVYPPFALGEAAYPVRLSIDAQVEGRNRVTVFFRIFMIIPHAIVLYLLGIAAAVVLLIAWFAALFTGSVPAGMHNFLAGVLRWTTRVTAYAHLLTDQYPPFSLS